MKMEILYEDEQLAVCYKPAGLPTQTKKVTQTDLVSELKNYRREKGEPTYVGVIHRLDQPVEGILVFAKDQETAASLTKQVQQRQISKIYRAVVVGDVPREGAMEDWILQEKGNLSRIVKQGEAGAKKAMLSYKKIGSAEGVSLVEINLGTGRHHQIRVQFASRGHAIVGDRKYGSEQPEQYAGLPLALCATKLEFQHPVTGQMMEYEIEPRGATFQNMIGLE